MNQMLTNYNESERALYMMVLAHMAGVDGELASEEIFALREMCIRYVLGPDARGNVMAATALSSEALGKVLDELASTDLKFSLVADVCAMAHLDGVVKPEEAAAIELIAGRLKVGEAQLKALDAFAKRLVSSDRPQPAEVRDTLASLEPLGITASSLAMSTAVSKAR